MLLLWFALNKALTDCFCAMPTDQPPGSYIRNQ